MKPKVSVLCLTYNQDKYIVECIESILNQKTEFEFELIIHDDASNDGTKKILKKYEKEYPDKVKVIYQKQNQYSKGIRNMLLRYLMPISKGEYIAICEGDDYWTDSLKLQKQVDFLDLKTNYSLCFHPVRVIYEQKEQKEHIFPEKYPNEKFNTEGLLRRNFIQTNSVMYRKQKYNDVSYDVVPGDWYLHLYHAKYGKIGFIDRVMSVYRKHSEGIWWTSNTDIEKFFSIHGVGQLALFKECLKIYGNNKKYKLIILDSVYSTFEKVLSLKNKHDVLPEFILKYPDLTELYLIKVYNMRKEGQRVVDSHIKHIHHLDKALELIESKYEKVNILYKNMPSNKIKRAAKKITKKITKK